MPDVITLGEVLVDFVATVSGVSLADAPAFKKAPGGAPANVAAALARLGMSAGFMGKVGDDPFGHFLVDMLRTLGVDTSGVRWSREARTALAFVSLRADGEREFTFYRHPSADMLYAPGDVDLGYIRAAKVFHFGSISLIGEPSHSATLLAATTARDAGLLVSYDPNLRPALWPSAGAAREGILLGWRLAHVVKVSEEEWAFLGGDEPEGVRRLWHDDLRLLVITRGRAGCRYVTRARSGDVPGFPVRTVDTTGAGDGFVAGMLKSLLETPRAWDDETRLRQVLRYANAVGALATTRRGAIPAMPTPRQVARLLQGKRGV